MIEDLAQRHKELCEADRFHEFQVGVMVTKKIGEGVLTPNEFGLIAKGIHDSWGVGCRKHNTGVLVLLSVEDRQVFISTGSGILPYISDLLVDRIIAEAKPVLKRGDFDRASLHIVGRVVDALKTDRRAAPEQVEDKINSVAVIMVAAFFGICGLVYFVDRRQSKRRKHVEKVLTELQSLRTSPEFNNTVCPICLENFPKNRSAVTVLSCGHSFDRPCIGEWLRDNTSCPVCRREIGTASAVPVNNIPSTSAAYPRVAPVYARTNDEFFHERLCRLQTRYPDLIDAYCISTFWRNLSPGECYRPSLHVAPASSSSLGGSSSSWGGGSSSGGGGGGGSW
eukprot:CAMPEP_0184661120 /NCGR_PEP_ID=MMETSP0308-20130426/37065_1 /TAXON_ID=38269 /ORGANISM="Gloeochaete witrockiana, Strain SAG 46.84" /LENGTH=337 /DNA_ID=CAMNT_0027102215 /DNA_START=154 /DNA_END=1167 /DNA_ORIENTATION=+